MVRTANCNCLSKFHLSAKKQDGSHYKKTNLLSIRAAIGRYLRSPPLNKKWSICDGIQFNEANKALNFYLTYLADTGKFAATIHKPHLTTEINQKLSEARELGRYEEYSRFTANNVVLRFAIFRKKRQRESKSDEKIHASFGGYSLGLCSK